MKKYAIIATVLVLTLSLLTGCGCTAKDSGVATMPSTGDTLLPTNIPETTVPTEPATMPSTTPATAPTQDATAPSGESEIGTPSGTDDGNSGISGDATRNRSRMR